MMFRSRLSGKPMETAPQFPARYSTEFHRDARVLAERVKNKQRRASRRVNRLRSK